MISESEVIAKLERWAEKKFQSGERLGFPRESAFRKLTPAGTESFFDDGVDMEFQQVEAAFRTLPDIPRLMIEKKYLSTHKNSAIIAHCLGISVRQFYGWLKNAHQLIANFLNTRLTERAQDCIKVANL